MYMCMTLYTQIDMYTYMHGAHYISHSDKKGTLYTQYTHALLFSGVLHILQVCIYCTVVYMNIIHYTSK